jgi:hypothetical protein
LQGLLYPVVTALKDIKFLFSVCKKGLASACKINKKYEIIKEYCMRQLNTFLKLTKWLLIALGAVEKSLKHLFYFLIS